MSDLVVVVMHGLPHFTAVIKTILLAILHYFVSKSVTVVVMYQ